MRRIRTLVVLASVAVLLTEQAAFGAFTDVQVAITNSTFVPHTQAIGFMNTVSWHNNDAFAHNPKNDASSPASFDVLVPQNSSSGPSKVFNYAGTYTYFCSIHPTMHGAIALPVSPDAPSKPHGQTITVSWASAALTGTRSMDIQVKKPHKKWKTILTDTQLTSTGFLSAKKSKLKVRARLEDSASGASSGYSPPVTLKWT